MMLIDFIFSLFNRPKTYITPDMEIYQAYRRIWDESGHIMIAGATGSGKSVLIRELIRYALHSLPGDEQFILCDPKRVDLVQYKDLPHTIAHSKTPEDIRFSLQYAISVMRSRYREMERNRQTKSDKARINVIIDESADLLTGQKESKQIKAHIVELCRLGRAANIRLIMATQSPSRKTLPAEIVQNCDRVALHCFDAIESRQILGRAGAETLPPYGEGYWRVGSDVYIGNLPMWDERDHKRIIEWWNAQRNGASKKMVEECKRKQKNE